MQILQIIICLNPPQINKKLTLLKDQDESGKLNPIFHVKTISSTRPALISLHGTSDQNGQNLYTISD